ncbi:MAG TPA: metallophosphoesterase [Candidatus Kapabacteria bacterium]|nr:metallophosphoesterase [Candidatus Kapabacteria bacterium]
MEKIYPMNEMEMLLNDTNGRHTHARHKATVSHINDISRKHHREKGFTLVHISDPHLSRQFYREHFKSFKILLRSILEEGCDHLLLTGDIVSTPNIDDFYLVREILAKHNMLSADKLTVVPGNHDIFGGPHRATDVLSFPQYIRNVDYKRHLALFLETFEETFETAEYITHGEQFPFVKRVGPFAIIGLNSIATWSLRKNPLGSNGELTDEQFEGLRKLNGSSLLKGTVPIVAIHHHFNGLAKDASTSHSIWEKIEFQTMRMRKRRKIAKLFNELDVQYVMHGHIHRNEIYEKSGITFANGAGAVCDDPVRLLKYNVLVREGGKCRLKTHTLPIPYQTAISPLKFFRKPAKIHKLEITASAANGDIG